jgi:hypothetical protein
MVDVVGVSTIDFGAFAFADIRVGNVRVTLIIFGSDFAVFESFTGSSLMGDALISSMSSSNFIRFGDSSPGFFFSFLLDTVIGEVSVIEDVAVEID